MSNLAIFIFDESDDEEVVLHDTAPPPAGGQIVLGGILYDVIGDVSVTCSDGAPGDTTSTARLRRAAPSVPDNAL